MWGLKGLMYIKQEAQPLAHSRVTRAHSHQMSRWQDTQATDHHGQSADLGWSGSPGMWRAPHFRQRCRRRNGEGSKIRALDRRLCRFFSPYNFLLLKENIWQIVQYFSHFLSSNDFLLTFSAPETSFLFSKEGRGHITDLLDEPAASGLVERGVRDASAEKRSSSLESGGRGLIWALPPTSCVNLLSNQPVTSNMCSRNIRWVDELTCALPVILRFWKTPAMGTASVKWSRE